MNTNQKIACVYVPTSKYNLEEAKAFLLTYKYKVKNFETSDGYYKFRQLTSQTLKKHGFIDYTAKEIDNTGIVLIIVSRNLDGGDFTNYIREKYNQTKDFIVSGSGKLSSKVKAILDKHGRDQIHSITIVRTQYDKLFHLSLVFNGNILIEKNSIVSMTINPHINSDSDMVSFDYPHQHITINQFIQNALTQMGEQKFFTYSAYDNNCQHFLLNLIRANGLANEELTQFIKQDTESIFSTNSAIRKLSNNITDIRGRTTEILGGKMKNEK
jgi:hypothetical protein